MNYLVNLTINNASYKVDPTVSLIILIKIRKSFCYEVAYIVTVLHFVLIGVQTGNILHQLTVLTDYNLLHIFPQLTSKLESVRRDGVDKQLARA